MNVTEDQMTYMNAVLDTPLDRICVKLRDKTLRELTETRHSHGILISPTVPRQICQGRDQAQASALLAAAMDQLNQSIVTVRGHGWGIPGDRFVWTGSTREFNLIWEID